jgi:hypothetical protein
MENKLENYLGEINHYLVVPTGATEILLEIKSHILEKTVETYGDVKPENIEKTIAEYGSPRKIAEKYLEETHIIAPSFRNYLFRYTWILFAFHFGLTCLVYLFRTDIHMFPPLFSIPYMKNIFDLLNQVTMTFIYDFGIVALLLYFITQSKKDIKLPWPKLITSRKKGKKLQPPQPKIIYLLLGVAGTSILLYLFLTYETIFFKSLNYGIPEPVITSPASFLYSLVILIWCGLEIAFYSIRFFNNTFFLSLVKNLVYLAFLWLLMNTRVEGELIDIGIITLSDLKTGFILILTVVIFLETLSNIYKIINNRQIIKT